MADEEQMDEQIEAAEEMMEAEGSPVTAEESAAAEAPADARPAAAGTSAPPNADDNAAGARAGAATAAAPPASIGKSDDRKLYSGAPVAGLWLDAGDPAMNCAGVIPNLANALAISWIREGVCTCGGTWISPGVRCATSLSPLRPICAICGGVIGCWPGCGMGPP